MRSKTPLWPEFFFSRRTRAPESNVARLHASCTKDQVPIVLGSRLVTGERNARLHLLRSAVHHEAKLSGVLVLLVVSPNLAKSQRNALAKMEDSMKADSVGSGDLFEHLAATRKYEIWEAASGRLELGNKRCRR